MDYKELEVWIEARKLVTEVYSLIKSFPKVEQYGLVNQIQRSSVSVASNIAEACGRRTSKDTVQFLYVSRGSLYELETQILLAYDQEYILQEDLNKISKQIILCKKLLNGFINYYNKK